MVKLNKNKQYIHSINHNAAKENKIVENFMTWKDGPTIFKLVTKQTTHYDSFINSMDLHIQTYIPTYLLLLSLVGRTVAEFCCFFLLL